MRFPEGIQVISLFERVGPRLNYRHSMICQTDGITPIAPAKWRGLDGMLGVFWDAEGQAGASAYYLSPDPRIVVFFEEVSSQIRMSNKQDGFGAYDRPMTRAIYVPAGMPLWTRFTASHRFSHLDLHLHRDRLLRFLTPSVGGSMARSILQRPVEIQDVDAIETLGRLLVAELASPSRHAVYAESLAGSIATALLDIPGKTDTQPAARLTQAQMNRLISGMAARNDRRMSVAEMAAIVGLSESWFATAFKQTTGKTPLQWQLALRIEHAQDLLLASELNLADIAIRLGFSDQSHLTKAFRQVIGETPAAWRRLRQSR